MKLALALLLAPAAAFMRSGVVAPSATRMQYSVTLVEEGEETVIESLALWGSVIEVKGLDPRLRGGLPKWQSDSGCDAFDKGR